MASLLLPPELAARRPPLPAPACTVRAARFPDDEEAVQDLLLEYERIVLRLGARMLRLGAELTALPGPYAMPHGALCLVEIDGRLAGCAALVAHETPPRVAEIRRLHVRAPHAAHALDALLSRCIAIAAALGCHAIRHAHLPAATLHADSFAPLGGEAHGQANGKAHGDAGSDALGTGLRHDAPHGMLVPASLRVERLERRLAPAFNRYFSTNARSIT
ncbi:MAG: GNAT family N-acetyltransferase [Burkholderia sp.]